MTSKFADCTLTIHLDNIRKNYSILKSMAPNASTAAVVKANGYGLGASKVANALVKEGCPMFFVAHLDEAIALREAVDKPIAVFHGIREGQEKEFEAHDLWPVLNNLDEIKRWKGKAILHVDTGMNRLGISLSEAKELANDPAALEGIDLQYVMSHMACLSTPEHELNTKQLKRFNEVRKLFPNTPASLSNSAGVMGKSCYHFDLTRPGCSLYGVNSVPDLESPLHQVATVEAPIIQIRVTEKEETVGYGATTTVPKGATLVTLPVGYADGYLRYLSHAGVGVLNGKRLPMVGRVSMDLIVLDASAVDKETLALGQQIQLLGSDITVDELAERASTIGYEILTSLGDRYKRVYAES